MSDLYSSQLKSSQVTHGALQPVSHGKLDELRFIKLHARQPLALRAARAASRLFPARGDSGCAAATLVLGSERAHVFFPVA